MDRGLFLRPHLLGIASLGIPGILDEPVLLLGLRYAGAVDIKTIFLFYPCPNLLICGHFCFRIKFTLIVIYPDYEGEPGAVHRQTGFGNGVRIPFVCVSLTKKMYPKSLVVQRFMVLVACIIG